MRSFAGQLTLFSDEQIAQLDGYRFKAISCAELPKASFDVSLNLKLESLHSYDFLTEDNIG